MPTTIQQIAPGIVHWTNPHPSHGTEVSSYLLTEHGVLFDPIMPPDGLEWFAEHGVEPREILLSCRLHRRDTGEFVARYGCGVHAARPGMHQFAPEEGVRPFDFGDVLPGGVEARLIDAISPDETAFVIPELRAVVVADGVVNWDGLTFVPDQLMGDDPEAVKRGLVAAYARLVEEVDFDHLLCAHGDPVVGTGRARLRDFVAGMA
jgi:glyoxylase-like metal-dependent hydrolase (beta-lactamase superfamily II)